MSEHLSQTSLESLMLTAQYLRRRNRLNTHRELSARTFRPDVLLNFSRKQEKIIYQSFTVYIYTLKISGVKLICNPLRLL